MMPTWHQRYPPHASAGQPSSLEKRGGTRMFVVHVLPGHGACSAVRRYGGCGWVPVTQRDDLG